MYNCKSRCITWLLVIVMTVSPSLTLAQQPGKQQAEQIDLSYVLPDGLVAAVLRPRRALTSPAMEMLPIEVFSAAGKQELGIDPLNVEEVIFMVQPPRDGPPEYAAVIRMAKPLRIEDTKLAGDADLRQTELEGRPYFQSQHPTLPGFYMPNDRTLLMAGDVVLKKMLSNREHSTDGTLRELLAQTAPTSDVRIVVAVAPNRESVAAQVNSVPVPPQWAGFTKIPELVDWAELDVAFTGQERLRVQLVSPSEGDAAELRGLILQLMNIGKALVLTQAAADITGNDPVQRASVQYAQRMANKVFEMFRPQRDGRRVHISLEGNIGADTATIGVLVALLLPALQIARSAARKAQSMNNMKHIVLAMHTYHEAHGTFPPRASFDEDGRPLLSWRVHVLPYLDQQALYQQFRLDEPWDSEHNRDLIGRMPQTYSNPSASVDAGKTSYQVPVGEGTAFEGREGTSIRQFKDGTSTTLLVVETNDEAATFWTQPRDWKVTADNPLAGLGNAHRAGFNVVFADGSVQTFTENVDPRLFLKLLTMAGGEPVDR